MEQNQSSFRLFSFVCLLSLSLCSSFELQTIVLNSLPKPTSLQQDSSWAVKTQSQTELSTLTTPVSLSLNLEHIDAFASHLSPEELFSFRLKRDETRVKSIFARAKKSVRSSMSGHHRWSSMSYNFSSSVVSGLAHGSGEYFAHLGVGTPPRYTYMVLDTGSDVTWIQCLPCIDCYDQTDLIFNPAQSSSFQSVPCRSKICQQLEQSGCIIRGNKCAYQVTYGDGSFTMGEFATETMTFRGMKVPDVALGCGHDNEGLFVGSAGLLGLGRGKLSFLTQAGNLFGNKFSYCLVDRSASTKLSSTKLSTIVFGVSPVLPATVFTPLITNPNLDTFYYVELVGISVGGTRVTGISGELFEIDSMGNGGIIIDSGTSVTRLTQPAYVALRDAFRTKAATLKPAPEFSLLDTCFDLSGKSEAWVPTMVMHFRGANVSLPANNYLIPVDDSSRFCLAFAGTMSRLSIIGNIQQQGFRVIFDMTQRQVGFTPGSCA